MDNAVFNLRREMTHAQALFENLADIIGEDEDARHDLVEGETDLHEALVLALDRITETELYLESLTLRIKQLAARKARFENQTEAIRSAIGAAMEAARLQKFECGAGTVSVTRVRAKVVVTDEADIPEKYWTAGAPKLDRKGLLADLNELDAGEQIPGATLSNGGTTITIRKA